MLGYISALYMTYVFKHIGISPLYKRRTFQRDARKPFPLSYVAIVLLTDHFFAANDMDSPR